MVLKEYVFFTYQKIHSIFRNWIKGDSSNPV